MRDELATLVLMIDEVRTEFSLLQKKISDIELTFDNLEQYSRSNCLILHGTEDSGKLKPAEVEKHVIEVINSKLKLPYKITSLDIDICHPLPSQKQKKPIIIKFVRRSVRNAVYANKRYFKTATGPKYSLTESLT